MLPEPNAPARSSRWLLALAMAIPVLAALSPRDLWTPDEPRYGRIAYDMERGGDWLVSRWNGVFDAEKPPLGYWIMAAAGRLTGEVGPLESRLPCALLAALAMLATARLGRRWFGDPSLGATAALLFSTSGIVVWNSSRAALDLPMTAFCLLAAEAGSAFAARPSIRAALGAGLAVAVGILFKGPHALYVPFSAVAGGCLATGNLRRLLDKRWLVAVGAMAALVAAWLVPALLWGEPQYGERLLGQLTRRIEGVGEPHVHAFPYLIGLIFLLGLPWTPLWVDGAGRAFALKREPAEHRFGLGACLGGVLLPLLLLSLAASKRELYVIPLLPCLTLLAAYALHQAPVSPFVRLSSRVYAAGIALVAVVAPLLPFLAGRVFPDNGKRGISGADLFAEGNGPFVCALLTLMAVGACVLLYRRRASPLSLTRIGAAAIGLGWVVLAIGVLPVVEKVKTWDGAIPTLEAKAPGVPVVTLGFEDSALVWTLRPRLVARHEPGEAGWAALVDRTFAPGAPPVVAAIEEKYWQAALATDPGIANRVATLWERRVGLKRFRLLVRA